MLLNDDNVDMEKQNGICLLAFVVDKFLVLVLYPSIFSLKYSKTT